MKQKTMYDVILLGAGIGNTTLATILSKQGFRVLILEKGSHPRFAVGESLVFRSALWFWILGRIYEIPEIQYMSSLEDITTKISPRCGSKLTFGFLYHREGEEQKPEESNRLIPPVLKILSESHLYREDTDLFLLNTAKQYGAHYRENCEYTDIDIDDHSGVTVTLDNGSFYKGRFLVDGSGFRSPLAAKLDSRLPEDELLTHSRALFSLFENVPAYDDLVTEGTFPTHTSSWHEGTLHHVFNGGWIWVIPFDNHERTANKQCSVGIMLDPRKYPLDKNISPKDEFYSFIKIFPSIAKHLEHARPTMNFIRTDRIQYGSDHCAGARYCMLHHAYSFIDPLFSRGIIRTLESIHALVPRLTKSLRDNDFKTSNFEYLNQMQYDQMKFTDKVVSNAYRSMANYTMWNALLHQWMGNELASAIYMLQRCFQSVKTNSNEPLLDLEEVYNSGRAQAFSKEMQKIYDLHQHQLNKAELGLISYEEAAQPIFEALEKTEFLPHVLYGWGDPKATHADFGRPIALLKLLIWGKTKPSKAMRDSMTNLSASTIMKMEWKGTQERRRKRKLPLSDIPKHSGNEPAVPLGQPSLELSDV